MRFGEVCNARNMLAPLEKLIASAIRCRADDATAIRVVQMHKHVPRRVVDIATRLIRSDRESRRHLAVWLLGELGYPKKPLLKERLSLLKSACVSDRSTKVRARAILSLGQLECNSATKFIRPFSRSISASIRLAVAQALPRDGSHETFAVLKRLAVDDDAQVREWATFSLGQQRITNRKILKERIKVLQAKLQDSHREVRLEAIRGLLMLGEFTSLRQLRAEMKQHRSASKFFDRWHRATTDACIDSGLNYVLLGCFEELLFSLNPEIKKLAAWT